MRQLQLCAIVLLSEGWRPEKQNAHFRTIQALPTIMGRDWQGGADYLDTFDRLTFCRYYP